MKMSGWVNVAMNALLFIAFVMVVWHYYRPKKKKEELDKDEAPKYTMLNDDDEKPKQEK
jgi:cbb3-type cytochrome oxidase subunit 3